jgi:DNA polymerase-3 subunit gamma/tau
MSYTVLARRYRSQSFDELVGQNAISQTLQAAIDQNRVAHAYLFTGTRGVGKTSTARIFANALNNPDGNAEIAKAIMEGRDTDTVEIDAASNNSVDNARELIANAAYRPMRGRKKIYIIDEVHMLSTAAFNSLLKTMEEPPEHVVFILCTTETHKVPATIQSRCQRFDFRNIPVAAIAKHLDAVLKGEKRKASGDLIVSVARLANGSMRDSLSLLDRLLATGKDPLTVEILQDLLGLPEREMILKLVDAIADGDAGKALTVSADLLGRASSADAMLSALAERFRDLMVLLACGDKTDLVDLSDEQRALAIAQSKRFDPAGLVHNIALCEAVGKSAKNSSFPRALVDALIVRLSMAEKLADVTAVMTAAAHAGGAAAPAAVVTRAIPAKKA